MTALVQARGLTKSYGRHRGIIAVSFDLAEGEVFGFLGPNGAGKTTTLRTLMGLLRPTSGSAAIAGLDCWSQATQVKRLVGYLPGEFSFDPALTGAQILAYLGHLRGGVDQTFVAGLAERLELDLGRRFRHYSHGNKQKVGLVQAFMHRPRLLILDEPTSGLDPLNQETVIELVREARAAGSTVFFSSHVLSEVEALCERVGFIREGSLVQVAAVHELPGMHVLSVEAECAEPPPPDVLAAIPGVGDLQVADGTVRCIVRGDMDRFLETLARYHVRRLVSREPSLNDIFLHLYESEASPPATDGSCPAGEASGASQRG
jgi:ABC-2 type transport system ATP-binding protein